VILYSYPCYLLSINNCSDIYCNYWYTLVKFNVHYVVPYSWFLPTYCNNIYCNNFRPFGSTIILIKKFGLVSRSIYHWGIDRIKIFKVTNVSKNILQYIFERVWFAYIVNSQVWLKKIIINQKILDEYKMIHLNNIHSILKGIKWFIMIHEYFLNHRCQILMLTSMIYNIINIVNIQWQSFSYS
jgi:hypothetical protein